MPEADTTSKPDAKHCPQCGAALREGSACAPCALELALLGAGDPETASLGETTLIQPPLMPSFDGMRDWELPHLLAGYELHKIVGRGGMGVVFEAHDLRLDRREVALKVIKLGMDTAEVMSRFEQERAALSLMDHPCIAKVLDAGATPEGRPFFVMELVRGVPITQYCIEHGLDLPTRLRLFKAVCSGVQHAHQKGILHRDLKPSNILVTEVDGEPVPKIIDFGIAKAITSQRLTEFTLVTQAEQKIGTPLYMSPEQVSGSPDIDTRSDVYALGVLLYELLAGELPFDAKTLMEAGHEGMRRIISEQVPAAPSRKQAQHPKSKIQNPTSRDLDLITLKALEKDRARRYESATALGDDVQRFLSHEPVVARAPSLLYLTQRWARRHRAAAAVVVAVLLGAGLAVWQAVRATRAEQEVARQLADAEAVTEMMTKTLAEMPFYGASSGEVINRTELMSRLHEQLPAFRGDPMRKARMLTELAEALDKSKAISLRKEALALAQQHLDANDPELWRLRFYVARDTAGATEETIAELRQVHAWHVSHLGKEEIRTLEMAYYVAHRLTLSGHYEEAIPIFREVVRLAGNPGVDRLETWQGRIRMDFASALVRHHPEEALTVGREGVRRVLEMLPDTSYTKARVLYGHALLCMQLHQPEEAVSVGQQALKAFYASTDPQEDFCNRMVGKMVDLHQQRGDTPAMLATLRESVRQCDIRLGAAHEFTAKQVKAYILALQKASQLPQADTFCLEWLRRVRQPDGHLPPGCEEILRGHAEILRDLPDLPRAEAALRELLTLVASLRPEAPQRWADQSNLAAVLIKAGRHPEAVPLLEEAVRELEKQSDGPVKTLHLPLTVKRLAVAKAK